MNTKKKTYRWQVVNGNRINVDSTPKWSDPDTDPHRLIESVSGLDPKLDTMSSCSC